MKPVRDIHSEPGLPMVKLAFLLFSISKGTKQVHTCSLVLAICGWRKEKSSCRVNR